MKQKIKEALQQGYKNLGISEKAFEGVATFATTFITDEAQIENFVKGAEPMLKAFQGETDKLRGEYSQRIKDLETQIDTLKPQSTPVETIKTNPQQEQVTPQSKEPEYPNMAAMIAESVSKAVSSITERLDKYESERNSQSVIDSVLADINKEAWINSYSKEKKNSWDFAMRNFDQGGRKLSKDELRKEFDYFFERAVLDKGGEVGKPIASDGGGQNSVDLDATIKALRESGRLPKES
jgi:hypothetical protein